MEYNENKFKNILDDIESGCSLRAACRKTNLNRRDFYKWIDDSDELKNQYARATTERHDKIFEEILEISDDGSNDNLVDKEGNEKLNAEHVQRSRLRVDSRKWMLGKMNPKKYGDRINVDQTINERKNVADLFPDDEGEDA